MVDANVGPRFGAGFKRPWQQVGYGPNLPKVQIYHSLFVVGVKVTGYRDSVTLGKLWENQVPAV